MIVWAGRQLRDHGDHRRHMAAAAQHGKKNRRGAGL